MFVIGLLTVLSEKPGSCLHILRLIKLSVIQVYQVHLTSHGSLYISPSYKIQKFPFFR